ncbi:hypothetical protein BRAO285_70002 [Bradyrhizobium sp. ORS 285]|nr:hypothetical protein BRAO285_70002 [Bradyrhizobium sp. ORS 285]
MHRTIPGRDSPSARRVIAAPRRIRHISLKFNALTTYPQVAVQPIGFLIESKKLLFCTPVTD